MNGAGNLIENRPYVGRDGAIELSRLRNRFLSVIGSRTLGFGRRRYGRLS